MADPIQVEHSFQELMGHFESTISIRHRYRLFRNFVENLEGSFKKYESYILQIIDELPEFAGSLTWSGIDPEQTELDLALLNTLNSNLDLAKKSENFSVVKKRLEEVTLLLFACLNDFQGVNHYLKLCFGITALQKENVGDESSLLHLLAEKISQELKGTNGLTTVKENQLKRISREINNLIRTEEWKVFIPVAERYQKKQNGSENYGRLRQILVDRYSEAADKDELIFHTNIYGASDPLFKQKDDLLKAARSLYETIVQKRDKDYYRGVVSFHYSSAFHDGNSANLAIAALWFTRLLEKSNNRQKYQLYSHIAITGDVHEGGDVLPVDPSVIPCKLQAAFFSWIKILAVPAEQRNLFEAELEKLHERYPDRDLTLVGVSHLKEIFYDRRLACHQVESLHSYYFNRLKNKKTAPIAVVFLLLLFIASLIYGPIDKNPAFVEYMGSEIVLKNSSGDEVDRLEVGQMTVDHQNNAGNFSRKPLHVLLDLNNDGINELIYSNRVRRRVPEEPFVRAWSVSGDSLIWDKKIVSNYSYPRQSAPMNFSLRSTELAHMNTLEGPKVAINASVVQYFQNVVFTLDAHTGETEQKYVHPGRFDDMYTEDLNDDGNDEIILVGMNNAYWKAVIAVLEYGDVNGYGPATIDYIPADIEPASEYRYILVPKTIIGKYFSDMQKYNRGKTISYDELTGNMFFRIQEGTRDLHGHSEDIYVLFYFDESLKPIGIGTSDMFDIVAREFHQNGQIPFEPGFDYFEELQDSLLYWSGTEFVRPQEFFQN